MRVLVPGIRRVKFAGDRAADRRVFYRVVHQIDESVAYVRAVSHGMDRGRGSKLEILLFFVGQQAQLIDHIPRQCSEIQNLRRQLNFSGVGARESQETLDEPREPVDLLQHAPDDVTVRGGIEWIS